jgi:3-deoxy-D-manno-octulosonic-acid transferase
MRQLYTIGFYLALPFILIRSLWRSRNSQDPIQKLCERLGFYTLGKENESLWLHAVSYGEAVASEPLLYKLKLAFPTMQIIITTMTPTGANRVQTIWKNDTQIRHLYLPYDIPFAIKRFFNQINPYLGIIMETELWPNLLYLAGKHKLPLMLANARLSPNSFKGYQKIRRLISPLLRNITCIAAQSKQDATRFLGLGVPPDQLHVVGNLKFDVKPNPIKIAEGLELKKQLPFDHIIVAASTHYPEEEQLLDAFSCVKKDFPHTLLVLVPRHPERFNDVAHLCIKKKQTMVRRSEKRTPEADTTVYLGDSMGELYFFYALADIAFVGGSLIPVGGHNLLEPAALKLPIVTGPHLFNFAAISTLLSETGTLHTVSDTETLSTTLCKLLKDKDYRQTIGSVGYEVLEKNQGATDRHLALISQLLA